MIEAGLDLSGEHLLTEICPVNSLVQRAGRCARFPSQVGTVHVYDLPAGKEAPYERAEIDAARAIVTDADDLTPTLACEWVTQAHAARDAEALALHSLPKRKEQCLDQISQQIGRKSNISPAELIRRGSDTSRILILDDPAGIRPSARESIAMYRDSLVRLEGFRFDPATETLWVPGRREQS